MVSHSKPSYYDLLKEGRRSWQQTQAANPNREEAQGWRKREESKDKLAARQADLVSGEVMVLVEDEGHLGWGDSIGYGWGRQHERTEVPMATGNQRQTYDGVMNRYHQEFLLTPYERGNGTSTVSLIEDLQGLHPDKKLIILWDRASYHGSEEVQTDLNKVNPG